MFYVFISFFHLIFLFLFSNGESQSMAKMEKMETYAEFIFI